MDEDSGNTRRRMVEDQLIRRGLRDARVLAAMAKVQRESFVAKGYEPRAYEDSALPIDEDQTISQPYVVAAMAEAAQIKPTDTVLEIGTGSGYAAAILAELAARVYTIERNANLSAAACVRFNALGYTNINLRTRDGTLGWPEVAPFNAILVAAAAPSAPESLKRQLTIGGRLIIPVGQKIEQSLRKITRTSEDAWSDESLGAVKFVPLIGEHGG